MGKHKRCIGKSLWRDTRVKRSQNIRRKSPWIRRYSNCTCQSCEIFKNRPGRSTSFSNRQKHKKV